jgi:hypothetical protein
MDKVELDWQHIATKKNTHRILAGKSPLWELPAQNQPNTQPEWS